ncbi:hypothetical protein [Pseudomonas sp. SST3]|uniref:hypothetical protein n=1 Tax=Pseudomonas sp. SST3 TaxID=2267882 RepID=UPI000E025619
MELIRRAPQWWAEAHPTAKRAIGWSLYLAWKVISRYGANGLHRLTAFSCVVLGTAMVAYGWYLQFWGWS